MGFKTFLSKVFGELWRETTREVIPVLDLHGMRVKEALKTTEEFLRLSQSQGTREVKLIYGKGKGSPGGKGVLREVIPSWISKEGSIYVSEFRRVLDFDGGDGGIIIRLKS